MTLLLDLARVLLAIPVLVIHEASGDLADSLVGEGLPRGYVSPTEAAR